MSQWPWRRVGRLNATVWLSVAVLVTAIVASLAAMLLIELAASARIDACLDSGGSYDYEREACDHERSHPRPSSDLAPHALF
jgi:hypothetical protein